MWRLERKRRTLASEHLRFIAQGPRDDQREAKKEISDRLAAVGKEIEWLRDQRIMDQAEKLEIPAEQLYFKRMIHGRET
jgi:hypothetical protein